MKIIRILSLEIILSVLCIQPLRAQYHITGDTLQPLDSIYWRPQWADSLLNSSGPLPNPVSYAVTFGVGTPGEWLMKHVVEHPIRVIGIACGVESYSLHAPWQGIDSMTSAQEYFRIYNIRNKGGEIPLRSIPWNPTAPHRYYNAQNITLSANRDSAIYGTPYIHPVYEVYFEDNPLVITDTFFIGKTSYSDSLWSASDAVVSQGFGINGDCSCGINASWTWLMTLEQSNGVIPAGFPYPRTTDRLWYIFPILSQDTDFSLLDSCPTAGSVWLDTTAGGSVLRWDTDSLHVLWQVGIGDTGAAHATRFLDTLVRTPTLDLAPLGITPPFSVQVRPQCLCYEYYDVWGDWGDCTDFLPPPEPEPCRPVDGLQFISAGRGMGTLAWTPDSMHTLWQVALGYVGRPVNDAWRDSIVTVPYLDIDSVMAPIAFTAHVRAMCGEDDWSPWATLTADPYATTGLLQPLLKEGSPLFTLTPNPTTGEVTVTLGQPPLTLTHSSVSKADSWLHWRSPTFGSPNLGEQLRRMTLTIHDAAGNEVMRKELVRPGISIDLSDFPAGTYFVTLVTPTGSGTQKLVVK